MIDAFETARVYTDTQTDTEYKISEQFEFNSMRGKPAEMLAGFIVRGAIDVARYHRSAANHPERATHYERLVRCATRFMNHRVTEYYGDHGIAVIEQARTILKEVDWQSCELQPTITQPGAVPYDGTELSWSVSLEPPANTVPTIRSELPA